MKKYWLQAKFYQLDTHAANIVKSLMPRSRITSATEEWL